MNGVRRPPDADERETIERLERFAEETARSLPQLRPPFVGHLRVRTGGRERDVLVSSGTRVEEPLVVVDWRRAPLAEVFFGLGPGEEYEIEAPRRTLEGTVLEKHLVYFDGDRLTRIESENARWWWEDGQWWAGAPIACASLVARPTRQRSAPTLVALDAHQRGAVEAPLHASLLVTGDAGYGKTTVALHRLSFLRAQVLASGRGFAALVVVPTEGLRRLTTQMLQRIGISDVEVTSFETWIRRQGRQVFSDVPRRDSTDVDPAVTRLKRHAGLREVLRDVAVGTEAMRALAEIDVGKPALRRDLLHLFGDRALLDRVALPGSGLTARAVEQTLAHTKIQFSRTTEQRFADVDPDRLRTVDGRAIDDGTPWRNADTIDTEDFAVLFEINRLRTGRDRGDLGRLQTYDLVVVDEAQEFSSLELAVLGRAVGPQGTVVVAGDEKQQVDDTTSFVSWDTTMRELGRVGHEAVELQASYRCPPPVERFARTLFPARTLSGAPVPGGGADDAVGVARTQFATEAHRIAGLIEVLVDFRDRDLQAAVAVVCRYPQSAQTMHAHLSMGLDVRLALDGQFRFSPGISVTCVDEVKGLEFDVVVVPDLTPSAYPDDLRSRKALYVAVTRATHQLWLTTVGSWSPLASSKV